MPEESPPAPPQPPVPEVYVIPRAILEQWLAIPPLDYLNVNLTRRDIDLLLFGTTKSYHSQQAMHRCIVKWSNGDVPGANVELHDALRIMIEGQNELRQFFTSVMASALKARADGSK